LNSPRGHNSVLHASLREPARVAALRETGLLDSPREEEFDRITRLTARLLRAPIALFSLVDVDRYFLKSSIGLPEPHASARELPHPYGYCDHVVATGERLVIQDAAGEPIARNTPAFLELGTRAYVGVPITFAGQTIGALCALDAEPREWTADELGTIEDLARAVQAQIDLRGQLAAARERHDALVTELSEVVYETDLDGRWTYLNRAWEHITGWTPEETIGRLATDFLVPDDRPVHAKRFVRLLSGEVERVDYEHRYVTKHGDPRWTRVRATLRYHEGKAVGIRGVMSDITERREAERESDRIKNEFFALVSHELRTPLTSITGYLEILLEDAGSLPEEHVRFLRIIARNAERLERLVGDLLFVAQLEGGELQLDFGDVDLADVVAGAAEAAEERARQRDIELVVEADRGAACAGDVDRLGQVADHLLSNALKFTPAGGRVVLRARRCEGGAVLEVSDTGAGLEAQEASHVFERFFRSRSAMDQAVQGVGLGLTIVKAIVDGHGGRVDVSSTPGEGTTFTVELPGGA
jgi:PAS domain S-box-containing protein